MIWARVWGAPLWAHLAALTMILLILVPVVGTEPSFTPDEGAAVIQATSLSRGDGWIVEHPFPEVDPTGELYPVRLSAEGSKGLAPLAKHPLYPVLLAGSHRVGGMTGMVLLSLAGTLAAAGLAAALAHRLDPGISRTTVWAVGLASPLLFDGYLVMGHTLAAAAAAGAVLAAVVAVERRRPAWALAVAPGLAVAVLIRNEALLLAAALSATAAFVALVALLRRRDRRMAVASAAVAATSVVSGVAAALGDRLWVERIVGEGTGAVVAPLRHGAGNLLSDRIDGFVITWLRPMQFGGPLVVIALLVMLGALVFAAFRARCDGGGRNGAGVLVPAGVAALASVVALAAAPDNVVPGLLVAFPLVGAGLVVLSRRALATPLALLSGGTFILFASAVIATQYRTGGTGEWGGRYFALGLPLVVPVLVLALRDAGGSLVPMARRAGAVSLAVCCGSLTTMGIVAHRSANDTSAELAAWVEAGTARVSPDDDRPVVVTTDEVLPRVAWAAFDDRRWLVAAPSQLEALVGRLRTAKVDRFALITAAPAGVRAHLTGSAILSIDSDPAGRGLTILMVAPGRPAEAPAAESATTASEIS